MLDQEDVVMLYLVVIYLWKEGLFFDDRWFFIQQLQYFTMIVVYVFSFIKMDIILDMILIRFYRLKQAQLFPHEWLQFFIEFLLVLVHEVSISFGLDHDVVGMQLASIFYDH